MSATEIAKAYVQIIPTTKGIKSNLESELGGVTEAVGKKSGNGFVTSFTKGLAGTAAAVAAATTAVSAVVSKNMADTAAYGDNIDKMSQKMGLTAEAYQEWDFIMQHAGTSMESLKAGMKTLATAAETNSDAFQKLGISQEEIAEMSQEELFSATLTALQGVQNETERTYLSGQLLGRGATELGALLNMSAEDVEYMRQQVHDLGGVMSKESVAASAAYADSLQNLQTSFNGITRSMTEEFLPGAVSVMDGLAAVFSGDGEGISKVKDGIQQIVTSFSGMIPQLLQTVTEIVSALVKALPDVLPQIISAITEFFVSALPQIADTGMELFVSLIEALPDAIDTIVDALPEIIVSIVNTLVNNIPKLIAAGVKLFVSIIQDMDKIINGIIVHLPEIIDSIVTAMIDNIPLLVEAGFELFMAIITQLPTILIHMGAAVREIVLGIVGAFRDNVGKIKDIGKNIVDGVWQGIQNAATTFYNNVKSFFSGIVDSVKDFLGIASPSKVFAGIGGFMAEGLSAGFTDAMDDVRRDVTRDVNSIVGDVGTIGANVNVTTFEPDRAEREDVASAVRSAFSGFNVGGNFALYIDGKQLRAELKRIDRESGAGIGTGGLVYG